MENDWDAEYEDEQAIPSSNRLTPSRAFTQLAGLLDAAEIDTVVDVGCGNGRNAIHAAQRFDADVVAVDASAAGLSRARAAIEDAGADVTPVKGDAIEGLPVATDAADLVVDSYVSCHFIDREQFETYAREVERILDDSGRVYWCGMSVKDEYYATAAEQERDRVVTDPLNGITKRLYDRGGVAELFPSLEPAVVSDVGFEDEVDGEQWNRRVLAALFA